eukprot:TRINITY_DN196_c4_g1_i1.p1 TRINITY_DN196_c4_g1~~TRINITY_DN196_c4_g1_i1.p1  ORF type:complete len:176 (-),score=76.31 TRINITY_DN196_c4_g1_i1:96-623(-)
MIKLVGLVLFALFAAVVYSQGCVQKDLENMLWDCRYVDGGRHFRMDFGDDDYHFEYADTQCRFDGKYSYDDDSLYFGIFDCKGCDDDEEGDCTEQEEDDDPIEFFQDILWSSSKCNSFSGRDVEFDDVFTCTGQSDDFAKDDDDLFGDDNDQRSSSDVLKFSIFLSLISFIVCLF